MQEMEQLKTELRPRDSSLKMLGVCLCAVSVKSYCFLRCGVPSTQLPHGALRQQVCQCRCTNGGGEGSPALTTTALLQELNEQQLKKQKDQQNQLDALTAKLESGEVSNLGVCGLWRCFAEILSSSTELQAG